MSFDKSALATKLLSKFGDPQYITIQRVENRVFDGTLGTWTGGTEVTIPVLGVVLNVSEGLIDGERIQLGDKRVLMDNAVQPLMDDTIVFGGVEYRVVALGGFNHAGKDQFFTVFCRD